MEDRIAVLLGQLENVEITLVSRSRANRTLDLLGRMQTRVASMMCDVTRAVSEAEGDSDPAEVDNLVAICRKHHSWLETENPLVRRTPDGYEARPRDGPRR